MAHVQMLEDTDSRRVCPLQVLKVHVGCLLAAFTHLKTAEE